MSIRKITDITLQKNGKRANIFLNGSYFCGLELITVMSAGLKVGDEIDEEALGDLQRSSESETAFNKAVGYLAVRLRTEKEVRMKLKEKGYLNSVIDSVVDKLKEYGYLDDSRFAEEYIHSYKNRAGEMKIRYELRRLGVESAVIEEKLSSLDKDDVLDSVITAAERYLRSHEFDRLKLSRHLAGKGYPYDLISEAVRHVQENEEA